MNNEPKVDDLLNAFENPDMVVEESPVAPATPEPTPAPAAPIAPEATPVAQDSMSTPEVAPTPDAPQTTASPVDETATPEVKPESTENVPANKDEQDDPNFMKKNIKFIGILFGIILVFIILLPTILKLLGKGY